MYTRNIILFIFSVLSLCGNIHYAQAQHQRTVRILMADGTSMMGVITECTEIKRLTFLVNGDSSNTVTISMDQVVLMDFGLPPKAWENEISESGLSGLKEKKAIVENSERVYHSISLGLLFGEDETNYFLGVESGLRMNDHFAVGLGLNYDNYDIISTVPVFVELKGYLHDNKVAPYYFVGAGYGFGWLNEPMDEFLISNEKIRGGLFGHTGLGYQVKGNALSYVFRLGYKIQKTKISYQYNPEPWRSSLPVLTDVAEKRMFRRLFFSVSAIF